MRTYLILLVICSCPLTITGQLFEDASTLLPANGAQGQSMDVRAIDLDNDTDLDIILANEFQVNTVLINQGDGSFVKLTAPAFNANNHDSEDIAVADFNQDGFLDILFCSEDDINLDITQVHELYLGDGANNFIESNYHFPDSEANAVITTDLNNDNIPDVIFGNNGQNTVFINQGDGTFVDETNQRFPTINRTTQDLLLVDIDMDDDLDLLEGNENGNILLINNGSGIFTDETTDRLPTSAFMETRKISAADINEDGNPDLFLSNVNFLPNKDPQNALYLNDGNGVFSDVTANNLPLDKDLTLDGIFEDVNLDGHQDIIVANVFGGSMKVYLNNGTGVFTNQTSEVFGAIPIMLDALGVIATDLNEDGFRDLYICDRNSGDQVKDLLLHRIPVISSLPYLSDSQVINSFPNPIDNQFYVDLQKPIKHLNQITFCDQNGKAFPIQVDEMDLNKYFIQVDSSINAGIYFLIIDYGSDKQSWKVIKQ